MSLARRRPASVDDGPRRWGVLPTRRTTRFRNLPSRARTSTSQQRLIRQPEINTLKPVGLLGPQRGQTAPLACPVSRQSEMSVSHPDGASYVRSGFSNRIGWGIRPVLLLVDVCKAYWTPGPPLDLTSHAPSAAAPDVMRRLLDAARKAGVPVIWTAVEYADPGMRDAGIFWLKTKALDVWRAGDDRGLAGWMGGLEPAAGECVYKKKYPSAFFGTTLATDLRLLGADTVVLCGVSTSGCVRASALDAMQYGFRPMVSEPEDPGAVGNGSIITHAAHRLSGRHAGTGVTTSKERTCSTWTRSTPMWSLRGRPSRA